MTDLENSNRVLLEGIVRLLRDNVDGWKDNEEFDVPNVWAKNVPDSANKQFPRGVVDIIAGNDFELDIDLNISLREVTLKLVVFSDSSGEVETLIDNSETAMKDNWEDYIGDWSMKEVDGFTELSETGEIEGDLIYSRSIDIIFEVIKN